MPDKTVDIDIDGLQYTIKVPEGTSQEEIYSWAKSQQARKEHKDQAGRKLFTTLQTERYKKEFPNADEQTVRLAVAESRQGAGADKITANANLRTNANRLVAERQSADTPLSALRLGLGATTDVVNRGAYYLTGKGDQYDKTAGASYYEKLGTLNPDSVVSKGLNAVNTSANQQGWAGAPARLVRGFLEPGSLAQTAAGPVLGIASAGTRGALSAGLGVGANLANRANVGMQVADFAGSLPFAVSDRQRFLESNILNAVQAGFGVGRRAGLGKDAFSDIGDFANDPRLAAEARVDGPAWVNPDAELLTAIRQMRVEEGMRNAPTVPRPGEFLSTSPEFRPATVGETVAPLRKGKQKPVPMSPSDILREMDMKLARAEVAAIPSDVPGSYPPLPIFKGQRVRVDNNAPAPTASEKGLTLSTPPLPKLRVLASDVAPLTEPPVASEKGNAYMAPAPTLSGKLAKKLLSEKVPQVSDNLKPEPHELPRADWREEDSVKGSGYYYHVGTKQEGGLKARAMGVEDKPVVWLAPDRPIGGQVGSVYAIRVDKAGKIRKGPNSWFVHEGDVPADSVVYLGERTNVHEPFDVHRKFVEAALRDGKKVAPEVLADYPDLTQSAESKVSKLGQKEGSLAPPMSRAKARDFEKTTLIQESTTNGTQIWKTPGGRFIIIDPKGSSVGSGYDTLKAAKGVYTRTEKKYVLPSKLQSGFDPTHTWKTKAGDIPVRVLGEENGSLRLQDETGKEIYPVPPERVSENKPTTTPSEEDIDDEASDPDYIKRSNSSFDSAKPNDIFNDGGRVVIVRSAGKKSLLVEDVEGRKFRITQKEFLEDYDFSLSTESKTKKRFEDEYKWKTGQELQYENKPIITPSKKRVKLQSGIDPTGGKYDKSEPLLNAKPFFSDSEPSVLGDLFKKSSEEKNDVSRTSVRQVPSLFKQIPFASGTRNIDIGGGRFDDGTEFLKTKGVQSAVLDPYSRSEEHNAKVREEYGKQKADTATVANVLNVVESPKIRSEIIRNAAEFVKPGGKIYFSVYEGNRSGIGAKTSTGTWQENRGIRTYLEEVKSVYPDARVVKGRIEATKGGQDSSGTLNVGVDPTKFFGNKKPKTPAPAKGFDPTQDVDRGALLKSIFPGMDTEKLIPVNPDSPKTSSKGSDKMGNASFIDRLRVRKLGTPYSVSEPAEIGGKVVSEGALERAAKNGNPEQAKTIREVNEINQKVKTDYHDRISTGERFIEEQNRLIKAEGKDLRKTGGELIRRIEMKRNDPERLAGASENMKTLIKNHDEFMEEYRKYIIANPIQGEKLNPNFGITDTGYFPRQSEGRYILKQTDGTFVGRFKTRKAATEYAVKNGGKEKYAPVDIEEQGEFFGNYIAQRKNTGALMKREGTALAYEKEDYGNVLNKYVNRVTGAVEVTKLKRVLEPHLEVLEANDLGGIADQVRKNIEDLSGKVSQAEADFGEWLQRNSGTWKTAFREVEDPQYALRHTISAVNKVQNMLKLAGVPKNFINNAIQPLSTLHPYISSTDFVRAYKKSLTPAFRKLMDEKGIGRDAVKNLELDSSLAGRAEGSFKWLQKNNFQTLGSQFSARVGYAYGYLHAQDIFKDVKAGKGERYKNLTSEQKANIHKMTPEEMADVAHRSGMAWKEKVEYDSSTWNIPPGLRGWLAKGLLQYKSYAIKNVEEAFNYARRQEGQTNAEFGMQMLKGYGVRGALAGTKGIIGGKLLAIAAGHIAASLFGDGTKQEQMEWAEQVYLGVGKQLQFDLSTTFGVTDSLYGSTPLEKATRYLGGPNVIAVNDAIQAGTKFVSAPRYGKKGRGAVATNYLKGLSPVTKVLDSGQQILEGVNNPAMVDREGKKTRINKQENFLRALGYTPASYIKQREFSKPPTLADLL